MPRDQLSNGAATPRVLAGLFTAPVVPALGALALMMTLTDPCGNPVTPEHDFRMAALMATVFVYLAGLFFFCALMGALLTVRRLYALEFLTGAVLGAMLLLLGLALLSADDLADALDSLFQYGNWVTTLVDLGVFALAALVFIAVAGLRWSSQRALFDLDRLAGL